MRSIHHFWGWVIRHFGLKKEEVLEQCRDWLNAAPDQITSHHGTGVGVHGIKSQVEVAVKQIRDYYAQHDVNQWIA